MTKPRARSPIFAVRASPIAGLGAFATRQIRKGERIIEYLGERITSQEGDARYSGTAFAHAPVLLFSVDERTVIDAGVGGNEARFINHSCEPNCEAVIQRGRVWIIALRTITPEEELTYDYNLTGDKDDVQQLWHVHACHCGSRSCRGTMFRID